MKPKRVRVVAVSQNKKIVGDDKLLSTDYDPEHPYKVDDPAHPCISDDLEARLKRREAVYEDD